MIDIIATLIIILATTVSIAGAILVSGTTNGDRKRGFILWQISNIAWIATFIMGLFGLISTTVFMIQQFCAGTTFLVYLICNFRGAKNNGDARI
jgi:ABC-type phosphate transport system permease subunit